MGEPPPARTASHRQRALDRAVAAWRSGKPHTAWQILSDAGMADYWPTFQRTALRVARKRYTTAVRRHGRQST